MPLQVGLSGLANRIRFRLKLSYPFYLQVLLSQRLSCDLGKRLSCDLGSSVRQSGLPCQAFSVEAPYLLHAF